MNPLRLVMRWLGALLDPILSRPADALDRVLAIADAKVKPPFRRVEAAPDAAPRRVFRAPEVPLRQVGLAQLGLREVRRLLPVMPGLMLRILRSGRFYRRALPTARTPATPDLLAAIEAVARKKGALDVAYLNDVRPDEIFRGLAVPAPGVIVFTVEMAAEPISRAPSFDTFHEVASGYRRLAEIGDAISELLQARGHAAFPGTALGGQTDYVAVAQRAGLGGIGLHGMLLTRQAGSRVRIATVYTNLVGLPERDQREHAWVQDFCRQCKQCVRSCPPNAILSEPRPRTDGTGTACIDYALCRDYFARSLGCAKCIAVCPFSTAGYGAVQAGLAHVRPGSPVPTDDRRFRVAVVGAGAAGFYTTLTLLVRTSRASIDLIERLPMPHGLVRYGVAPDHPEVRSKGFTFDEALRNPRVRFFGNVALGRDVSRAELLERYDAVIYATGAAAARSLGVPGENLRGSVDAPSFVGWYNAHPDLANLAPPLDHSVAVLLGAGNVALDVARMLAAPRERLRSTDIAEHALRAFEESAITDIHVVARSGPAKATFTPRELRDLAELPGVVVQVNADDLADEYLAEGLSAVEHRRVERNLKLLAELASRPPAAARVRVHLHFGEVAVRLEGDPEGRVAAIVLNGPSGERSLGCGLVIRAIGFESVLLADVPFDAARRVIPTREGRVVDDNGHVCPKEYASGWVRRGPRGIIGTNKVDAEEVVERLLADLPAEPGASGDLVELLADRGVRVVDGSEWDRIRQRERLAGSRVGRAAVRDASVASVLKVLDERAPLGGAP